MPNKDIHGYYVPYYDKHGNKNMGKFFKSKEDAEKHLNDNPHRTDSYYPVDDKYNRVNEDISDVYKGIKRLLKGKKSAKQVKQDYTDKFVMAKGVAMQFPKPKSGRIKSITKTAHDNYNKSSRNLTRIRKIVDKNKVNNDENI